MKGLLLTAATAVVLSGAAFSHMMMHPHGYHPMMGMGGMMMMHDPETQKIIKEHMIKCRKELMKKLAARPSTMERMLHMMIMHPESFKEVIKKNPELRDKLRELLE